MEDTKYWRRNERAIAETDSKYGIYCHTVSMNILGVREDAEECVNDTYTRAWNAMRSERPGRLRLWLARITWNLSFNRRNRDRAQKRGGNMYVLLSELDECIPDPKGIEQIEDAKELGGIINAWPACLTEKDFTVFMRCYWAGESVTDIARSCGMSANALSHKLARMRRNLRKYLVGEGVAL